jgi:hypothetical protein
VVLRPFTYFGEKQLYLSLALVPELAGLHGQTPDESRYIYRQIIVSRRGETTNIRRGQVMNRMFVSLICAGALFLPIVANGQVSTVGGSESIGKITDYTPDSALVLDTGSGEPVHYKFAKRVTYVDKDGTTIQAPALTKNLRVKVHYIKQGGDLIVDKVTLAE